MTDSVIVLLCGVGFIASLNLVATLALARRVFGKSEEQKSEDAAQAAFDEAAARARDAALNLAATMRLSSEREDAERREAERSAEFDEGVDNIMRFAVNGMTGLEGERA